MSFYTDPADNPADWNLPKAVGDILKADPVFRNFIEPPPADAIPPEPVEVRCVARMNPACLKTFKSNHGWLKGWKPSLVCPVCEQYGHFPPKLVGECDQPGRRLFYCSECQSPITAGPRFTCGEWYYELQCGLCGHHGTVTLKLIGHCKACGKKIRIHERNLDRYCKECRSEGESQEAQQIIGRDGAEE